MLRVDRRGEGHHETAQQLALARSGRAGNETVRAVGHEVELERTKLGATDGRSEPRRGARLLPPRQDDLSQRHRIAGSVARHEERQQAHRCRERSVSSGDVGIMQRGERGGQVLGDARCQRPHPIEFDMWPGGGAVDATPALVELDDHSALFRQPTSIRRDHDRAARRPRRGRVEHGAPRGAPSGRNAVGVENHDRDRRLGRRARGHGIDDRVVLVEHPRPRVDVGEPPEPLPRERVGCPRRDRDVCRAVVCRELHDQRARQAQHTRPRSDDADRCGQIDFDRQGAAIVAWCAGRHDAEPYRNSQEVVVARAPFPQARVAASYATRDLREVGMARDESPCEHTLVRRDRAGVVVAARMLASAGPRCCPRVGDPEHEPRGRRADGGQQRQGHHLGSECECDRDPGE